MSKQELLDAYVAGRISRRAFIRGLTALGISQSSAVMHAAALRPGSSVLADDLYGDNGNKKHKDNNNNKNNKNNKNNSNERVEGSQIALSGDGGVATAAGDGGAVSAGDVNSGGNVGSAIAIGDTQGPDPQVYGGDIVNQTGLAGEVDGGTAIGDTSGGGNNLAGAG